MLAQWNSKKISDEKPDEENRPLTFTPKQRSTSATKVPAQQNEQAPDLLANHSNGIVTLHLDNLLPQTKICVYDATGKCVLEETTVKKPTHDIDLSAQSKGVYVMEITSGDERAVTKILVE
jgi:hypothetical protein